MFRSFKKLAPPGGRTFPEGPAWVCAMFVLVDEFAAFAWAAHEHVDYRMFASYSVALVALFRMYLNHLKGMRRRRLVNARARFKSSQTPFAAGEEGGSDR